MAMLEIKNLGIDFGGLGRDAQRKEHIHNQPVTCPHAFGERLSGFRQKHAAIGARRCDSARRGPAFRHQDHLEAEAGR